MDENKQLAAEQLAVEQLAVEQLAVQQLAVQQLAVEAADGDGEGDGEGLGAAGADDGDTADDGENLLDADNRLDANVHLVDMSWADIEETTLDGGLWVMKTAGILLYAMDHHRGNNAFMQLAYASLSALLRQHTDAAKSYLVSWSASSMDLGNTVKAQPATLKQPNVFRRSIRRGSTSKLLPPGPSIDTKGDATNNAGTRRATKSLKPHPVKLAKLPTSQNVVSRDERRPSGSTDEQQVLRSPTRATEAAMVGSSMGSSPDGGPGGGAEQQGGRRATHQGRRGSSSGVSGSSRVGPPASICASRSKEDGRRGSVDGSLRIAALPTEDAGSEGTVGKTLALLREYHYFSAFATEALSFLSIFCPEYHPDTVEVVLMAMRFHAKRAATMSKGLGVLCYLCQHEIHSRELVELNGVEQLLAVRDEFGVSNRSKPKMAVKMGFKKFIQAQIAGHKLELGDKATDVLRELLW
jgi:hypothetical protein